MALRFFSSSPTFSRSRAQPWSTQAKDATGVAPPSPNTQRPRRHSGDFEHSRHSGDFEDSAVTSVTSVSVKDPATSVASGSKAATSVAEAVFRGPALESISHLAQAVSCTIRTWNSFANNHKSSPRDFNVFANNHRSSARAFNEHSNSGTFNSRSIYNNKTYSTGEYYAWKIAWHIMINLGRHQRKIKRTEFNGTHLANFIYNQLIPKGVSGWKWKNCWFSRTFWRNIERNISRNKNRHKTRRRFLLTGNESYKSPPSVGLTDEPRSSHQRQRSGCSTTQRFAQRRNTCRGIRDPNTVLRRAERRATKQRENRRIHRGANTDGKEYPTGREATRLTLNDITFKGLPEPAPRTKAELTRSLHHTAQLKTNIGNKPKKAHYNIATLNLQGAGLNTEGIDGGKVDEIVAYMEAQEIDLLCLQETKRPLNDTFTKGDYCFVFSSDYNTIHKPKTNDDFLHKANAKPKPIKGHGKGKRKLPNPDQEHIGVGFCYSNKMEKMRESFQQISGREIHIKFRSRNTPLYVINVNAPQQGRPPNERIKFFEELDQTIWDIPRHYKLIVAGDFNARLHGRYEHEKWALGKHVFGRGIAFLHRRKAEHKIYNRDLFLQVAIGNHLIVANTWFQKQPRPPLDTREICNHGPHTS